MVGFCPVVTHEQPVPNCPVPGGSDAIHWTRTYACSHVMKIGTYVQVKPAKFLGTGASNYAWEEWLDPKSARAWKRTVYYQNLYLTGELIPEIHTTTLSIGCTSGGCGSPTPVTFVAQKGIVQTHTHFMDSPGSGVAYPNPQTKIDIAYPGAEITGLDKYLGPPTGVRCDSLTNVTRSQKPGCVYHWYTPVYEVDYTGPMKNIAQNIHFGQQQLRSHPGLAGKGQPLVRGPAKYTYKGVEKEFSRWSREVSCAGSITRPPGQTCDEYPFASTWNGAHWVAADAWTCRFVPKAEQDYQSKDIQNFTDDNRLWRNPDRKTPEPSGPNGGPGGLMGSFWVTVTNAPSTPPSFSQCQKHL